MTIELFQPDHGNLTATILSLMGEFDDSLWAVDADLFAAMLGEGFAADAPIRRRLGDRDLGDFLTRVARRTSA